MSSKYPKGILKEQLDQRVKLGASWDWKYEELGNGRFRATCNFYKEKNSPAITGVGEELGRKPAEHSAAKKILQALRIDYSSPIPSPKRSSSSSGNSSGSSGSVVGSLRRRTEALDDDQLLQYATAASQNFVGMLQEFCDKSGTAKPTYSEDRWLEEDNSTRFKTTCRVDKYVCTGVARHIKDSKKIAALKCCAMMKITSIPEKPKPIESRKPIANTSNFLNFPRPLNHTAIDSTASSNKNSVPGVKSVIVTAQNITQDKVTNPEREINSSVRSLTLNYQPPTIPHSSTTHNGFKIIGKIGYDPTKIIGKGGFATVYEGYLEKPSRRMAIRRCSKADIEDPKSKELLILSQIEHENLMKYYITEEEHEFIYIAMDLAHSTLDKWIQNPGAERAFELLIKVCRDVTTGLKELHRQKIIHRDIKPHNVLIFLEETSLGTIPKAKLTDFGLSRVMDKRPDGVTTSRGNRGTDTYLPPEVYLHTEGDMPFDLQPSFDIFSLGILLAFTMSKGRHIFAGSDGPSPIFIPPNIMRNNVNWELVSSPELTSLRNLLRVMLAMSPAERSQVNVILEHPFFWDSKRTFDFILAVSNDIKNNATDNTKIQETFKKYKKDFPNTGGEEWKSRLDEPILSWIADKDRPLETLEETGKKANAKQLGWRKYKGGSVIHLINFIRDQNQHYENMSSHPELQKPELFGPNYKNFGSYFVRKFPELATVLYNVLQDKAIQGKHVATFYRYNRELTFKLI